MKSPSEFNIEHHTNRLIIKALTVCETKAHAAERLGISPKTLNRRCLWLQKIGITLPKTKEDASRKTAAVRNG